MSATTAATAAFVTATVAGQLFGIPIERAQDVFTVASLTPVPLAPADVLGLTNLRGRVVTALDIRPRLGLPARQAAEGDMAVGIQADGEPFGIVVDRIGEIVTVDPRDVEPNPVHLHPAWAALSRGVYGLDDGLLLVLDVDALLEIPPSSPDTPRISESPQ